MKYAPLGPIKSLTIHCSGSPARRGDTATDVCKWDVERFRQPSYHWVVEESGKKVRCLPDTAKGVHVALHNSGNIGVCYIGGIRNGKSADTRTPAQRQALREIAAMYSEAHTGLIVRGHRDWPNVHKDCPCFDVKTEL